ncbi:hypothetical protein JCM4814A_14820 [Streptomyces phaeofaciens JCM 4814]|uniref:M23ase beta-sheet core domain-containing protein n=1 Tax=Streptomyces phaeofaciens TaxID=68254 RepID=A0A918LZ76_9ACTN|nr:M23 family metallopeptidase [Streptomyces phaeofaciens]GGT75222.1 hypothetical protein GCM10010226_61730 [Streptomyces phaeofaciens]
MRRVPSALAVRPAVPLALLLVTLAAVPAGAGAGGQAASTGGAPTAGAPARSADPVRGEAARAVRAHEAARARVDRLRANDAGPTKIEAAEQRRKEIRAGLWDLLWAAGRAFGDPVAVDPSGQAGQCPLRGRGDKGKGRDRGTPPKNAGASTSEKSGKSSGSAESGSPASKTRPWSAPTRDYWLSAGFAASGTRWAHRHTGQDFAVNTGTPVYAVGPGTVRATTCGDGFGNQVVVRHPDGYFTQYAHLSHIDVRAGERVAAGERLGLSGATGNVTGPHLHFEVRITPYLGSSVAPLPWLRNKDVRVGP